MKVQTDLRVPGARPAPTAVQLSPQRDQTLSITAGRRAVSQPGDSSRSKPQVHVLRPGPSASVSTGSRSHITWRSAICSRRHDEFQVVQPGRMMEKMNSADEMWCSRRRKP